MKGYHICHLSIGGCKYISMYQNVADGYRPQTETTWSVCFYDFMKNALKHLLALHTRNFNGKHN